MLLKVDTQKTKFSKKDMTKSLIKSWIKVFEKMPKKEQVAIIFAQWSLETGQGDFCWNNNIGNYKAKDVQNKIVKYIALNNVWEIINGKKVILSKDDPGSWFLAFDTLDEGVEEHLKKLSGTRWKTSWSAVVAGDPVDFAHKLKLQKYYTAPEEDYKKLMNVYFKQFTSSRLYEEAFDELYSESPEKLELPIHVEIDSALINNDITPISFSPEKFERNEEQPKDFNLTFWQKILLFFSKLFSSK